MRGGSRRYPVPLDEQKEVKAFQSTVRRNHKARPVRTGQRAHETRQNDFGGKRAAMYADVRTQGGESR